MEYNRIIAVTGLPGLFELVSSKTDGAIVRSLDDKIAKFVSSRVHNFSHLESVEVYTIRENVNLVDIFKAMEKNGGELPSEKDVAAIKKYFQEVYPDMDFERVYASDMKKMVKWFSVIKKANIAITLGQEPLAEAVEVVDAAEEKPAKKAKAAKADDAGTDVATAEAKPKKAAKKKKTEE